MITSNYKIMRPRLGRNYIVAIIWLQLCKSYGFREGFERIQFMRKTTGLNF